MAEDKAEDYEDRLTPLQRRFVQEYLVDRIAGRAAKRAGYAPDTANQAAYKLLNGADYAHVQQAIRDALEADAQRYIALKDRIVLERCRIAFADLSEALDDDGEVLALDEIGSDLRAAITEWKETTFLGQDGEPQVVRRLKLASKNEALTALEKITGLTKDRVEHSGALDVKAARTDLEQILRQLGSPTDELGGEGGEEPGLAEEAAG